MTGRELTVAGVEAANRNDMDVAAALVHHDFVGVVPPSMSAEPPDLAHVRSDLSAR